MKKPVNLKRQQRAKIKKRIINSEAKIKKPEMKGE